MIYGSQHTSAALTVNENFDEGKCKSLSLSLYISNVVFFFYAQDVRKGQPRSSICQNILNAMFVDMDMALDTIVPESLDWLHTDEGPE